MPKLCLFCPNRVNSKEHLWSEWILEDLKESPGIRMQIGNRASVYLDKPDVRIRCVCKNCNNHWMSDLETSNKPAIRSMMHGEPCGLTKKDQKRLALWAILKAMVIESSNTEREHFYRRAEREQLKPPLSIVPPRTLVWLGQFPVKSFHAGGTDVWSQIDEVSKAIHSCVTTIIVGHLVIQSLTARALPPFENQNVSIGCKDGNWDKNLLDIWPALTPLRWPPAVSFTVERGPNGIFALVDRWRIGKNVG